LPQWYVSRLFSLSPDGNQESRIFPVHQSPFVLLQRKAFDRDDRTPSWLKITHSFVSYGLSVTEAVLPQRMLIHILDILTHLWYY
jgi:hypothetical protein